LKKYAGQGLFDEEIFDARSKKSPHNVGKAQLFACMGLALTN